MTDKRIPLDAQYGYAKPVKEITAEQLEDIGNALWLHNFVTALTEDFYTATTEGSSVTQKTPLDAQQIIKAAVQAIEDVVEENVRPRKSTRYRCDHNRWDFEHCDHCIREHLIPHLQSLKGLIDD